MEIIKGKKSHQMTRAELAAAVAPFKAVTIDVGTGDGRLVYRLAQEQPVASPIDHPSARAETG